MASSNLNDKKPELADDKEKKVTIGNYISLIMACVFFSGVCATNQWWGIFDFTTINGSFGKVVTAVSQNADGIHTAMANFRGKGGSGAIDGFMFALTLVPTVMFALAMITVFDHYGALKAARQMLTPILRPLIGVPGGAGGSVRRRDHHRPCPGNAAGRCRHSGHPAPVRRGVYPHGRGHLF